MERIKDKETINLLNQFIPSDHPIYYSHHIYSIIFCWNCDFVASDFSGGCSENTGLEVYIWSLICRLKSN